MSRQALSPILERWVERIEAHSDHAWVWRDWPVRGYWCEQDALVLLPLRPDMAGNPADFGPAKIGEIAPIPPELTVDLVLALPEQARASFEQWLQELGL